MLAAAAWYPPDLCVDMHHIHRLLYPPVLVQDSKYDLDSSQT